MRRAAGPMTVDPSARSPAIRPRTAILRQDGAWEKRVGVGDEVVCRGAGGSEGPDALRANLSQELRDVRDLRFDLVGNGAALSGGVGTLDEEEVREGGCCEAEIRVRVGGPGVSDVVVVGDDGERGTHVDVCACGADDRVDFTLHSVDGDDAFFGEVLDGGADEADVVFGERFEVTWPWCQSPAVRREVWHNLL